MLMLAYGNKQFFCLFWAKKPFSHGSVGDSWYYRRNGSEKSTLQQKFF
jgi:hypothetical protein